MPYEDNSLLINFCIFLMAEEWDGKWGETSEALNALHISEQELGHAAKLTAPPCYKKRCKTLNAA